MPNPGGDVMRCTVCNSPQRVLSSKEETNSTTGLTENVIQTGCLNDSEPTNGHNPCPRYAGGESPDPDLITEIRNPV